MCMEDVRLGRKTRSTTRNVPVGVASVMVAPPSPSRTSLLIKQSDVVALWLSMESPAAANVGYVFNTTLVDKIDLNIRDHGDAVTRAWYAVSGSSVNVFVMETFLEER